MSIGILTVILLISLIFLFLAGLPVGFTLGSVAMLYSIFLWGPNSLQLIAQAALGSATSFMLIAIPLFVLMGNILERSGIAESLYKMIYLWTGNIKGGLAIGTIFICTMMAAMVGVIGAGIVTMGIIALPSMLQRKYNEEIAMGSIMAGGALGALIPPSVPMILYCSIGKLSVGKMFVGGILPGAMLAIIYMFYVGIRCYLNPNLGPPIKSNEAISWKVKLTALKESILPIILIILVLGSIFTGMATPTEASAVGAFGAFLVAIFYGKFSWNLLKESCYRTAKLFGMVMWILIGAECFSRFYMAMGAAKLVNNFVIEANINPWLILIGMQLSLMMLGMIMEDYAIIMISTPIYAPIITSLGFDPLWFGILVIINMQIAVLTPPYGFALFYMKGVTPNTNMYTIYRSIFPFIPLQIAGLILVMVFPKIATWLPSIIFKF